MGLHVFEDAPQGGAVGQVAVVQEQAGVFVVRVFINMVDAVGVEGGGAADDAVDFVSLL